MIRRPLLACAILLAVLAPVSCQRVSPPEEPVPQATVGPAEVENLPEAGDALLSIALPADCLPAAPMLHFSPLVQTAAASAIAPITLHIQNLDSPTCPPRWFGAYSRGIAGGGDGDYLPYPSFTYNYNAITVAPGATGTQHWDVRLPPAGEVSPPADWSITGAFRMPDGSSQYLLARVHLAGPVPSVIPSPYATPVPGASGTVTYPIESIYEACHGLEEAAEYLDCTNYQH